MRKLMNAYCAREGCELESLYFLYDGEQIHPEYTPEHYEMEDGDTIDVHEPLTGMISNWTTTADSDPLTKVM